MRRKKRRKKRPRTRSERCRHRLLLFESLETRKVLAGATLSGSVFFDADQAGTYQLNVVSPGTFNVRIEAGANQRQTSPLGISSADGSLTPFDVLLPSHVSGPARPTNLSVSPDGNLAVAIRREGGVAGVYESTMVIVSPDGKFVYAGSDTIGVFARDPATGLLSYLSNMGDRSTIEFREAEFSSDGKFLYVARSGIALNIYQIDTATGVPTLIDTVAWCYGINPQQGDHSIDLSNDDRFVYSVSQDVNAILVYARDPITGLLSEAQSIPKSDMIHDALNRLMSLELSHDGDILYVSGFYDATIALFSIDPITGFAWILEASSRYEYPFHGGGNGDGSAGGDRVYAAIDGFFRKHGDHNGNGSVDLFDFAGLRRNFGT